MRFASLRVGEEWKDARLAPRLRAIVEDAADFARELWSWDFLLTCVYRTPAENDELYGNKGTHLDGVHVRWRGVDVRTRDVDPDAAMGVAGYINQRYIYDPERPLLHVALFEHAGPGSSAQHLHFQASDNTTTRYQKEPDAS